MVEEGALGALLFAVPALLGKGAHGGWYGGRLGSIRQAYKDEVDLLKPALKQLRMEGVAPEVYGPLVSGARREIGMVFKSETPQPFRSLIFFRNTRVYGDKWGPTPEFLFQKYGNWDDVAAAALRVGKHWWTG
jgi:hypothetical protein